MASHRYRQAVRCVPGNVPARVEALRHRPVFASLFLRMLRSPLRGSPGCVGFFGAWYVCDSEQTGALQTPELEVTEADLKIDRLFPARSRLHAKSS